MKNLVERIFVVHIDDAMETHLFNFFDDFLTIFVADDQAQYRPSYCLQFETKKNLNGLRNTLLIHSILCKLIKM